MGRLTAGGIASHLENLKRVVLEWLQFENADSLSPQDRDAFYIRVQTEGLEKPPQPEPLAIYYQMKNLGFIAYWQGGFSDQPYIWMLEMNTCAEAENEFKRLHAINLKSRMDFLASKVGSGG